MDVESPRIAALTKELAQGQASALESFWTRLESEGTPLIEPIEGDSAHSLVTFLWNGESDTSHVCLYGGPEGHDLHAHQLRRVPETDIFFRTCLVRNDMRASYNFMVDLHLVEGCKSDRDLDDPALDRLGAIMQEPGTVKSDPLNLRRQEYRDDPNDPSSRSWGPGVLEMPEAPAQPWINKREGIQRGWINEHLFRSDLLDNERVVRVYTPPGYSESQEEHGLLVVFDGGTYLTRVPTHRILDNLQAEGRISSTVAVFIDHPTPELRHRELALSEAFVECLAGELLPWVRQKYRFTNDPRRTTLAGSSFGGLMASFAAFRHPDLFGNVLSQSGSYQWGPQMVVGTRVSAAEADGEWLTSNFASSPLLPIHFYLEAGTLERGHDPYDLLGSNQRFRDVLQAKGYALTYGEFVGGHDYDCWRGSFADGLIALQGLLGESKLE